MALPFHVNMNLNIQYIIRQKPNNLNRKAYILGVLVIERASDHQTHCVKYMMPPSQFCVFCFFVDVFWARVRI